MRRWGMSNQVTLQKVRDHLLKVFPDIYQGKDWLLDIDSEVMFEVYNSEGCENADSVLKGQLPRL